MRENVLIILAAGINTNVSRGLFRDFMDELKKRYDRLEKNVKFIEVYPLGEVKQTTVVKQVLEVGVHMHHGTGGSQIVSAVKENLDWASKIILIGHSGGGQAVGDALVTLEKEGISVHHVVQIGAPAVPIHKKYVHKVTRVQTSNDYVARNIQTGTEAISHGINPMSGVFYHINRILTKKMPEIIILDLNITGQKWGGHSSYFNKSLKNNNGIDNVTATINGFWDKIK